MTFSSLTGGKLAHLVGEQPLNQWIPGISFVWVLGQKVVRPYGTFMHPNVLAAYLIMALVAVVALWLNGNKRQRFWLSLSMVVIGGVILLSLSRTAWMIVALIALLWTLEWRTRFRQKISAIWQQRRVFFLLVFTLIIVATLFSGILMWRRIATLWGYNQISVAARASLSHDAITMLTEHPLGVGPAHFTIWLRQYDLSGWFVTVNQPVHQIYLLLGAEQGWLGMFSFGLLLFGVLLVLLQTLRRAQGNDRLVVLSLLSLWIAVLVTSFVDHFYWSLYQGELMLWGLAGLSLGVRHFENRLIPSTRR